MENHVTQFSIKYRPDTFSKIRGHNKIVSELKRRTITNDWPQVMLFSGKTGVGKDTLAFLVAKTINCSHPIKIVKDGIEFFDPCNECVSCKSVLTQAFNVDIHFIDCSSVNKEDVLKLKSQSQYSSTFGGNKKVFIIDEFQALLSPTTKQAFLAMIEKPNPNCIYIFTTMDLSKVPDAIKKGRAQHYKLNPLTLPDLSSIAFDVLEKEKDIEIDEVFFDPEKGSLNSILIQSEGSARNLMSMLERVLYGKYFLHSELKEVFDVPTTVELFSILKKLVKKEKEAITELQAYSSLEEFFYLSYETLSETIAYRMNDIAKNDWKEKFYVSLLEEIPFSNLISLLEIYNNLFEKIGGYFKNSYALSKFMLFVLETKNIEKTQDEKTGRRRVVG